MFSSVVRSGLLEIITTVFLGGTSSVVSYVKSHIIDGPVRPTLDTSIGIKLINWISSCKSFNDDDD